MSKLILFIVIAMAISLIGASVVFAQTTPGTAIADTICPNGGLGPNGGIGNLEQMAQRHEAMGGNVPAEMQERHAAMSEAIQNGDVEKIQELHASRGNGTCQRQGNAQQ